MGSTKSLHSRTILLYSTLYGMHVGSGSEMLRTNGITLGDEVTLG